MGELVAYRPGGGTDIVEVPAVVMREPVEMTDGTFRQGLRLKIARGQALTIIEEGRDLVDLAAQLGRAPQAMLVAHVDPSEPGSWILELSA
jgi:hypothetical protein